MSRVELIDPGGNIFVESNMSLIPERWSYDSEVGFFDAIVRAEGRLEDLYSTMGWLGYDIIIKNDIDTDVWEGKITGITVSIGNAQIGISLDTMYNKVKVLYSTTEETGNLTAEQTAWFENAQSISKYGSKELIFSQSNLDSTSADTLASNIVNELGTPRGQMSFQDGDYFVEIRCSGKLLTMGWVYYFDGTGLEGNNSGSSEQPLGLGFTSNEVGFLSFSKTISSVAAYFKNFSSDTYVTISGSTSNNGVKFLESVNHQDQLIHTTDAIFFEPTDDMKDFDLTLDILRTGELVKIEKLGTGPNDGYWWLTSVSEDVVNLAPGTVVLDGPAWNTITQGNSVTTQEPLTDEMPSASVTITAHGQAMYYSFQIAATEAWVVNDVYLKLKKVGTPSDNVNIRLLLMTGVDTYTTLATANKSGTLMSDKFETYKFTLNTPYLLTPGVTYGIMIEKGTANSPTDFYQVAVDENMNHSGTLRLYDGAVFQDRYVPAVLWYSLSGTKTTTEQMEEVIESSAQHITSHYFEQASSGITTAQFMSKEENALERFRKLLRHGNSTGGRYVIESYVGGVIKIALEVDKDTTDNVYRISRNGDILESNGAKIENGILLQNKVVVLDLDMQPNGVSLMTNKFNVGSSEWDERRKKLTVIPSNASGSKIVDTVINR